MSTVAEWLPYVALLVVVISVLLAWRSHSQVRKLEPTIEALTELHQSQQAQMQIMQESLLEMGRHIISLDARVNQLRQSQRPSVRHAQGDQTEYVLSQLEAGKSVEQIAAATGLDEVEISLMKQIQGSREQTQTDELGQTDSIPATGEPAD